MTDLDLETRCTYSDLPGGSCAHCVGDDPTIRPGDATYADQPRGRLAPIELDTPADVYKHRAGETPTLDPKVRVARDLRAILVMAPLLAERGIDLSADHEMPGGDATAAVAPVALPSAWERRTELTERAWMDKHATAVAMGTRIATDDEDRPTMDEEDDLETPLQTLLFWSEDWRHQLGMDYGQDPTLTSEANFLANADVIAWAVDHEPRFKHFAESIADTRTRVENIVREGEQETRSRVICDKCDKGKRLTLVYGKGERPDVWKCPSCKARFDNDALKRAHAKQMRAQGAAKWVDQTEAIGVLHAQGVQARAVRSWIRDDAEIETYTDQLTGKVNVWWPSLWRKHLIEIQARADRKRLAAERKARRAACTEDHGPDCWERGGCTHQAVA